MGFTINIYSVDMDYGEYYTYDAPAKEWGNDDNLLQRIQDELNEEDEEIGRALKSNKNFTSNNESSKEAILESKILNEIQSELNEKGKVDYLFDDNFNANNLSKSVIRALKKQDREKIVNTNDELIKNLKKKRKERIINIIDKFADKIDDNAFDYNLAKGSFTYTCSGKKQNYSISIKSIYDAIVICAMLQKRNKINKNKLSASYRKTYDLFEHADLPRLHQFSYGIYYEGLENWLNIKTKGRKKNEKKIYNPLTKRYIKNNINNKNYKQLFGKIKLKKVLYDPLQNYKFVDYEVTDYCVPSYLSKHLLKKEYKIISKDIEDNKTPTYEELTTIMNKIDYNLNVFITDNECIQEQNLYKKNLKIMIHKEHMYVLKNTENNEIKKYITLGCTQDEYEKINSEVYTNSYKICNGVKHKLQNRFKKINDQLAMKNSFSQTNVDFFNTCGIRAVRYIDEEIEYHSGMDINKCYYTILKNEDYVFPVQLGVEHTELFNKGDIVQDASFYFIELSDKDDEILHILFGKKCWILGYILNKLKLKVRIKYKHMTRHCVNGKKDLDYKYIDIIHYTGHLAKYESDKSISYECEGLEAEAYEAKYDNGNIRNGYVKVEKINKKNKVEIKNKEYESDLERVGILKEYGEKVVGEVKPNFTIESRHPLKNSGMYSYLAILQYARLQLYYVYKEVKKMNKDIKIYKIYTDSIYFSKNYSNHIEKLNKSLEKYNFSVKKEDSSFTWDQQVNEISEPIIKNNEIKTYENVEELLNSNTSFCINAKPGYGKTHMTQNVIIPYLESNNKKYILSSTTIKTATKLNCEVLNSLLLSKKSSVDNLNEKFKDIDYLIVDECSLLSISLINIIQFVKKNNINLKLILIGDMNQCSYENTLDDLMNSELFNSLIDHSYLSIKWHEKARYGKDYDDFLNGLLKYKSGRDYECIKYIYKYFKGQVKSKKEISKDRIILTYTNDHGKTFGKNENDKFIYTTVHRAQGETYNEKYSIYEIERMDIKVMYTALSRCSNPKLITIYL